ncbi:MAG: pyrroline-5-carboxylate reductase [Ruegeria sp.]
METIAFIGGGNMASAILGGLIAQGMAPAQITVIDPGADQRAHLQATYGVRTTDDVTAGCADADTVVLAVKPQVIAQVAERIAGAFKGKLLISIAAGVSIARLEAFFGPMAIVRTMPNTPALLGLGATGIFANDRVDAAQRARAQTIVQAFGLCVDLPREDLLDVVTAVSGSGPAYFHLLIEEMIRAGVSLGLTREDATALTLQTALGAALMAAQGDVPPEELRRRVTSPNGTTHAAITSMRQDGFADMISRAMTACRDRAVELGRAE